MIKALQKKFIFINMLLVAAVLITVFSVQCISKYKNIEEESIRALQMALNRREDQKPPIFEIGQQRPDDYTRKILFVVQIEPSNTAKLLWAEQVSVSTDWLYRIVSEVPTSQDGYGAIKEYGFRYMVQSERGIKKVAFVDFSEDISAMRHTILTAVVSCLAALAAFLLISLYLSRWALQPVERAWEQQRQFVADASHELKTPLTVILANIGIMKSNRSSTIKQQIGWVENTEAEAVRMKTLVDNLLFLAKMDDKAHTVIHGRVNLSDIVFNTALAFDAVAFEKNIMLDTAMVTSELYVSGNEGQLKQVIGILLDNAVKYADKGSSVTLSLKATQTKAVLTVLNYGLSLTAENEKHIFDRFYRADQSRATEGHGLGLSIAKRIVETHGGGISVMAGEGNGTAFTVTMPVYWSKI